MSVLNPVVSKFVLTQGAAVEIYSCPAGKSHAIVDLSFFKDDLANDALIACALSTDSNPANLTSVDYFIDDIELIGLVNSAELNKVIVGAGERLYLKVVVGPDIVVRMSGVEEINSRVLKAGRLAAGAIAGVNQTQIYESNLPNTAYTSTSITLFNTSTDNNAQVEAWISSSAVPAGSDKIMKITIPSEDTTIIENVLLGANEKVYVKSSEGGLEYFVNGVVVSGS